MVFNALFPRRSYGTARVRYDLLHNYYLEDTYNQQFAKILLDRSISNTMLEKMKYIFCEIYNDTKHNAC